MAMPTKSVPVEESRQMAAALKAVGADVRYTAVRAAPPLNEFRRIDANADLIERVGG
jgi:hypothetical protein